MIGENLFGIFAFGMKMDLTAYQHLYNKCFKQEAEWIYYLATFLVFYSVTSFPVYTIAARKCLMEAFMPDSIPDPDYLITKTSFLWTIGIFIPIVVVTTLTTNLGLVIDIVSGIFGTLIVLSIPALLVIVGRKCVDSLGLNYLNNPNITLLKHNFWPWSILIFSFAAMIFMIYSMTTTSN